MTSAIAFSIDLRVMMSRGLRSFFTASTSTRADSAAESAFAVSGAASCDEPSRLMPSASKEELMVLAVYWPPQAPTLGQAFFSMPSKSSRDIITRKSIENAIALVMATGGSTNAVLHYLAIASAAGVKWAIDDFERVRRKVPLICNLKPFGPYVATDFHAAGGVPQVLKMLLDADVVHGECMTITGKTLAEELKAVPRTPRADQDVIRPMDRPLHREGYLAILKGNLAPEGCV